MKDIKNTEFVIFDVETTGLSPLSGDRMIEFAAIKSRGEKEISRYETLIHPEREVSYEAFLINGISDEMLVNAPTMKQVAIDIMQFMSGACLVAHNIKFDLKFLESEFEKADKKMWKDGNAIDTIKMARGLFPGLSSYSLSAVTESLGIRISNAHRAMADVEATFEVFQKLLVMAEENQIRDLSVLTNLYGTQPIKKQTKKDKMQFIEAALTEEKDLTMLYSGSNSGTTLRDITPKEVLGAGRNAMLACYCHMRSAERSFLIDKIVSLQKVVAKADNEQLFF